MERLSEAEKVSPAALVERALCGEERAWDGLVERYADLVWSIARGHGLDSADSADVSQTTWLRLAEHLGLIRDPDRLGAWLATTARRECLRTLRRMKRQIPVESCIESLCGTIGEPTTAGEDLLLEEERDEALWRAFEALSGPCKALLRALLADPPPSYAEVSQAFDMPVGSIGPTRARCLGRLRNQVEPGADGTSGACGTTPITIRRRAS